MANPDTQRSGEVSIAADAPSSLPAASAHEKNALSTTASLDIDRAKHLAAMAEDLATEVALSARHAADRIPRPPPVGAVIRHYELIRTLGHGGMGQVYLARDTRLGRLVALKFLTSGESLLNGRFVAEARATAQLSHENIVSLYDIDEHHEPPYMVLEYVKGQTLRQWLDERAQRLADQPAGQPGLLPSRAIELILPVVRALVYAHKAGIVHRDLKPSNIMLSDSGLLKVLDFGVAKHMAALALDTAPDTSDSLLVEPALTRDGARVGTATHMSPEQWRAEAVDHRTDIWSVGILLYELVTGKHPLAPLTRKRLTSIADMSLPMPSVSEERPDLGKLATVIDRCLLKDVDDRLGSAQMLLDELLALTRPRRKQGDGESPYTGLAAFQEQDADRFFGRDQDTLQVMARLLEQPLVAVVGPSGAGKSSFVRAGVIPALKRAEVWETWIVRPGSQPLAALAELLLQRTWHSMVSDESMLVSHSGEEEWELGERERIAARLRSEPGYLGARLRARARRKLARILVFVDQCEELYTLAGKDERDAFLACLGGIADEVSSPLRVILAIRSDYLDRMAEAHATITDLISRSITLLRPMDREGLRKALVVPAEEADHRFESPGLVEEILDALVQTGAGALPLLQFTAAKLWEVRDVKKRVVTEASYRRLGGVAGTLASHADAVLGAMTAAEQRWARAIFVRLVTPERTRALVPVGDLRELAGSAAGELDRVLSRLIAARLVMVEGSGSSESTVELVHESLISKWPKIGQWLSESEEDAAFIARLRSAAGAWDKGGRPEGLLWRGEVAKDAERWYLGHREEARRELTQREEHYLAAVVAVIVRGRRRRRALLSGVIAVLTLVAASMSYLAWERKRAMVAANEAVARVEEEAMRARDATRMAAVRAMKHDPTTQVALLREIEGRAPHDWALQARHALHGSVAYAVLAGHSDSVTAVAFSPDGSRVLSHARDGAVRVWRADGKGEPLVLIGHTGPVLSAAWSPDGSRIASSSEDGSVRVWHVVGTGQPLVLAGHTSAVLSVAWSPDTKQIASSAQDGTVLLWPADGKGEPRLVAGHTGAVLSVVFSPDGRQVVSTSEDHTARVWHADGSGEPRVLAGHVATVATARFSPDGTRIATGSHDSMIRVWSADGSGEPRVLRGHTGRVFSLAFSPDGSRLASASTDKTLRVWNADGSGEPLVLAGHTDTVMAVAFSPDGRRIVSASADDTLRVWNADGSGQSLVLTGHANEVLAAAFSPDGNRVASSSDDRTVRLWQIGGSAMHKGLRGHEAWSLSAAFSPRDAGIASGSRDSTIRLWNADGSARILRGHTSWVLSVAFRADGARLVSGGGDGTVRVWDVDEGRELMVFQKQGAVSAAAFSPDGGRLLAAVDDTTVHLWNADGSGALETLRGHTGWVRAAVFSPDGSRVASSSDDGTVRVWRADGVGEPVVFRGHSGIVWSVAFHPGGDRLVSAGEDQTVRLWSLNGALSPRTLYGHKKRVVSVAFSPDGTRVASASNDGTVRIWNADGSGESVIVGDHEGGARSVAFSPDGGRLVTTGYDHEVRIWADLEPLMPSSASMWQVTTYCIPVELRQELLGISADLAAQDLERCRRRVAAAAAPARAP